MHDARSLRAGQVRSVEMAAGVVCFSAADPTFAMDAHFERAVGAVGRPWIGIEAQAVLGAEFAVDAVNMAPSSPAVSGNKSAPPVESAMVSRACSPAVLRPPSFFTTRTTMV